MTFDEISVAFDEWYMQNKYSQHTTRNDKCIRDRILRFHEECGQNTYAQKTTADFLCWYESYAAQKGIAGKTVTRVRKIASLLDEYYETGTFVWKNNVTREPILNAYYTTLHDSFVVHEEKLAKRAVTVIKNIGYAIKTFLIPIPCKQLYT